MKTLKCLLMQYDSLSQNLNPADPQHPIVERFAVGSLTESVKSINSGEYQIEAKIDHSNETLSRIGLSNINTRLYEENGGVWAEIDLADDTMSQDIWERINKRIITKASIEFKPLVPPTFTRYAGGLLRTHTKAQLIGFAIVANPAYLSTNVEAETAMRSITKTELEQIKSEIDLFNKAELLKYYAYTL